ncbi:ABC transporter ATP-binding protein [Deferribacter abyssi]|uniref:ABC transporter ATP-binding protein n=1 Tax=Deferribacter abyssi TaxID=213806 RepID=UPI003C13815C
MNIIEVKNLNFVQDEFYLKIKHLEIKKGEKVALLGENGAGKSTFFNLISGIYDNYEGEIDINGKNIKDYSNLGLAKAISYLPQFSEIIFGFSVFETVLFGRYPKTGGNYGKKDYELTEQWLEKLELTDLRNRKFRELSGGEKRRVMLARVFNQDSNVVVLDEPFSMIDVKFIKTIRGLLDELDKTVICSVHDINQVRGVCDRVVFLKKGEIAKFLKMDEVTREVLNEIFEVDFNNINGYFLAV